MSDKKLYSKFDLSSEGLVNKQVDSKVSLEYYLLKSLYEDEEENKKVETFGVEVVKKEYKQNKISTIEQESAKYLSINKEKVECLLENLSKNAVTPISLYTILDNFIGIEF